VSAATRVDLLLRVDVLGLVEVSLHGLDVCLLLLLHDGSTLTWLHHGQDLGEALAIARNPFRRLSEWQSLPHVVINRLAEQVDDALLATGAVGGADILLGEHGALLLRTLVL